MKGVEILKNLMNKFFSKNKINYKLYNMQSEEEISKRFPLNVGDFITFESGKKYKICNTKIVGDVNVNSYYLMWVDKSKNLFQNNEVENNHYNSLRELNYYLEKEKHLIKHIKKNEVLKCEKELTIEECYELALKEESKRKELNNFFSLINKKV